MLPSLLIFCTATIVAFHSFLGEPSRPLAIVSLVATWNLSSDLALWVLRDATVRGLALPYDSDSLFLLTWPFATLIYLFRTRGVAALAPIASFMLMTVAGWLFAGLLAYPQSLTYLRAHWR
jgi:hypothetical protein